MKMQNPQPDRAKGTQVDKLDLKHKNSIAIDHSNFYAFTQAFNGKNDYICGYHNTEVDDLLEIAANLMPAWGCDQ